MSRGTREPYPTSPIDFAYGAITLFGQPFQDCSAIYWICNLLRDLHLPPVRSHYPEHTTGAALHVSGLGYSPFARRYSGNRYCFLFLGVLRCFTSPRSPLLPMDSAVDAAALPTAGCPIRESPDHCLLAAPRGLSQLAAPFIASRCQGIHRLPLVA